MKMQKKNRKIFQTQEA